jgi:hypothetical protein
MMRSTISSPNRDETSIRLKNRNRGIKALAALSLSLAVYGMIGWVYVATCALVAPDTLHLPLTHLLPHLREDTSGVISFIVSFIGFVIYRVVQDNLFHPSTPAVRDLWYAGFMEIDDDLAAWSAGLDNLFVSGRAVLPGLAAAADPSVRAGLAGAPGQQERLDAGGGGRECDAGADAAAAQPGHLEDDGSGTTRAPMSPVSRLPGRRAGDR